MKAKRLPEDADSLVALAQGVATVLEQKRDDLGINADVEALLRASIASAQFAIDTYLAILAGATKSPVAASFLAEAQTRCDRNIEQLRRRVTRSITQLCRLMDDEDLLKVAQEVLLIST
jgi:hypothetical protein